MCVVCLKWACYGRAGGGGGGWGGHIKFAVTAAILVMAIGLSGVQFVL